jgi:hypothetical protein
VRIDVARARHEFLNLGLADWNTHFGTRDEVV